MVVTTLEVNAQPVKRFFIDIITRDVGLIPAILDLVDNSVDSARTMRGDGSLKGLRVDIVARADEFSIADNCAGISVSHATDYVFRMGRPEDVETDKRSIGQFGVGLKRSVFKLGKAFIVNSRTEDEAFEVDLDVEAWKLNPSWNFDLNVTDPDPDAGTGTIIIVSPLHDAVLEAFANPNFEGELRQELGSRHRLAIGSGLQISLNGQVLLPAASDVASSELISPAVYTMHPRTASGERLDVRIVAGVAPGKSLGVDEDADPEEASFPANDAGWSVFANGRMLLANEKTRLTGWGSGKGRMPMFHNQYARFRGFVYIDAADSSAIPWNTMKTGVDADDPIWTSIVDTMILAGKDIVTMLNVMKVERHAGLKGADAPVSEAIYTASKLAAADPLIDAALNSATPVGDLGAGGGGFSMNVSELRSSARYPESSPAVLAAAKRITYQVDPDDFDVVARRLGISTASGVGRETFERFLLDEEDRP